MVSSLSAGMPIPLSRTLKRRLIAAPWLYTGCMLIAIDPRLVNLIALPIRLISTCLKRVGSPTTKAGDSGPKVQAIARSFSCALGISTCKQSSTVWRRSKGICSRLSLPASILEKSRMSLMMSSNDKAERCTITMYSWASSAVAASKAKSVIPMMPFIGVRISWLMLAKKSLFARLASLAVCSACDNSAVRCTTKRSACSAAACKDRFAL